MKEVLVSSMGSVVLDVVCSALENRLDTLKEWQKTEALKRDVHDVVERMMLDHEGTILTSQELSEYLKNYKVIEEIFDSIWYTSHEVRGEAELIGHLTDQCKSVIKEKGRQIPAGEEGLIQELFTAVITILSRATQQESTHGERALQRQIKDVSDQIAALNDLAQGENRIKQSADGIRGVEEFWKDYCETTVPKLNQEFFLLGREGQIEKFEEWRVQKSGILTVIAESALEAKLFAIAYFLNKCEQEVWGNVLIIESEEQWRKVLQRNERNSILMPTFNFTEGIQCSTEMKVILPVSKYSPLSKITQNCTSVKIEKRVKALYRKALKSIQDENLDLEKIEAETKRSFLPFYRRITQVPSRKQPAWLSKEDVVDLIPAFLVGAWEENCEGDREALEWMSGIPYEEYVKKLQKWLTVEDTPIFKVMDVYQMVSITDIVAQGLPANAVESCRNRCGSQPTLSNEADDDPASFSVVSAQTPCRHHLDSGSRPRLDDPLFQLHRKRRVEAVADGCLASLEAPLVHVSKQPCQGLLLAADFADDLDLSLFRADPDSPQLQLLRQEARHLAQTAVLDQVVERAEGKCDLGLAEERFGVRHDVLESLPFPDQAQNLLHAQNQFGAG